MTTWAYGCCAATPRRFGSGVPHGGWQSGNRRLDGRQKLPQPNDGRRTARSPGATSDRRRIARGIRGLGYVTVSAYDDIPEDLDDISDEGGSDDIGRLDDVALAGADNVVPVGFQLLEKPVTDAELRAAGITDLEVQRQPPGADPSWISKDQLNRLEAMLNGWPELADPVTEISVSSDGASYGNRLQNKIVELAAVKHVRQRYEDMGWHVEDVSQMKCGWDLTCRKGSDEAKVEGQGTHGRHALCLPHRHRTLGHRGGPGLDPRGRPSGRKHTQGRLSAVRGRLEE